MLRPLTSHIVIHTAAWPGDPGIHDIRRVHVDENGWSDVGYHYLIRKDGTIEAGRHESKIGAHCRNEGMNRKALGICLSGHHDQEEPTDAQLKAMLKLCRDIMQAYDIPRSRVIGHREAGAHKTCPGLKINMDKLRKCLN